MLRCPKPPFVAKMQTIVGSTQPLSFSKMILFRMQIQNPKEVYPYAKHRINRYSQDHLQTDSFPARNLSYHMALYRTHDNHRLQYPPDSILCLRFSGKRFCLRYSFSISVVSACRIHTALFQFSSPFLPGSFSSAADWKRLVGAVTCCPAF